MQKYICKSYCLKLKQWIQHAVSRKPRPIVIHTSYTTVTAVLKELCSQVRTTESLRIECDLYDSNDTGSLYCFHRLHDFPDNSAKLIISNTKVKLTQRFYAYYYQLLTFCANKELCFTMRTPIKNFMRTAEHLSIYLILHFVH